MTCHFSINFWSLPAYCFNWTRPEYISKTRRYHERLNEPAETLAYCWTTISYIYIYVVWSISMKLGWILNSWCIFPWHPLIYMIYMVISVSGYRGISNLNRTGWWFSHPSEKYEFVNWDDDIPQIWENKKWQPNHQPVFLMVGNPLRTRAKTHVTPVFDDQRPGLPRMTQRVVEWDKDEPPRTPKGSP